MIKHKATYQPLQDRQKLYQVGAITQKMFLIGREQTQYQLQIDTVEKNGQVLTLRGKVRKRLLFDRKSEANLLTH